MQVGEPIKKFYLHTPSTITVVGSSGVGKTTFVEKLVTNWDRVAPGSKPVGQFVLCYLHWQPAYDRIIQNLLKQFPECQVKAIYAWDENFIGDEKSWDLPEDQQSLLLLDDIFEHVGNSKAFQALYKNLSHHKSVTVIFVTQDLNPQGVKAEYKTAMKNGHYIVVMKNTFHGDLMVNLGRKLFPKVAGFLSWVYKTVTGKNDHGYFVIDNSVSCERRHSVKTGIFGELQYPIVFVPPDGM
jgi:hypothetical protein